VVTHVAVDKAHDDAELAPHIGRLVTFFQVFERI